MANQERVFQTLSRNILFLQPAKAEYFFTPSKNIKLSGPIRTELFKTSQGIFYSFSQPGQKYFSHLHKTINYLGQSGHCFLKLQPAMAEHILKFLNKLEFFIQSWQKYFLKVFPSYIGTGVDGYSIIF